MTASLNLLVLLHKEHLADGEFVLSIDAVPKKHVETVLKNRTKEGYCLDKCLMSTGKSAAQEVDMKNGSCSITYKIDGALQPQVALCLGENVLLFYGNTNKECRRMVVLVQNPSDASGTASIAFSAGAKFLHRVIIKVPGVTGVDAKQLEDPNTSPVALDSSGSVSGRRPGDEDIVEHVISDFGATSLDEKKTEAKPFKPDQPDVIISLNSTIKEFGQYEVVLSNAALIALARAIGPQDARRLLIGLNVPYDVITANLRNHTGDVVTGIYESLIHWRNMYYQPDGNHQGLVRMLTEECAAINRNDLVVAIAAAVKNNQKLANFLPQ